MQSSRAAFFLCSLVLFFSVARADDAAPSGIAEGLKQTAQPLLKALSLIGTPYKYGSSKPEKGLDCSGFVRHVYKESANVSLPRTAADMSKEGEQVAETELQPGDLVFFDTRNKPFSHVGIYAGNGEFVHASSRSSKQVTISRMQDSYWSSRFSGARRVLQSP